LREERRLRVFEDRVLRRIFGPKRDEIRGKRRKPRNEDLIDLYSPPNIFRVIISRRMRWAWHVACMGRGELCTESWWGNLRERDQRGDPDVDRNLILRWIYRKWDVGVWTGLSLLRIETYGVNELSGSIKCAEFLD
jgi:hypothetical protein